MSTSKRPLFYRTQASRHKCLHFTTPHLKSSSRAMKSERSVETMPASVHGHAIRHTARMQAILHLVDAILRIDRRLEGNAIFRATEGMYAFFPSPILIDM